MFDEYNIPEFFDFEKELSQCEFILAKLKADRNYAQNLYAACCNMRLVKKMPADGEVPSDVLRWMLTVDDYAWTASWRYIGNTIADLRDQGEDYLDFYCSAWLQDNSQFVAEGVVTDEVREDVRAMGWEFEEYLES